MLNDIDILVFDLDGTLYEDVHHFDYYADRLCEKLNPATKNRFYEDYKLVKEKKHPLKIGTVYDADHDLILTQKERKVVQAVSWTGEYVSEEQLKELYPNEIEFNFDSMINVGDFWWVPASIARHYGLSNEGVHQAFLQTREYMMSPDFQMKEIPGFKEALLSLHKTKKLVLLTNSPQKDSEVIVKKLGFSDFFDLKIFEGKKPVKTEEHLINIHNHYDVPFSQIVSIGDNAINEIIPAAKLGCKTIFIHAHEIGEQTRADYVVNNIAGVVDLLRG